MDDIDDTHNEENVNISLENDSDLTLTSLIRGRRGICGYTEWKIQMNAINWISVDVNLSSSSSSFGSTMTSGTWWCKHCHYISERCAKFPHRCDRRIISIKKRLGCKCEDCSKIK